MDAFELLMNDHQQVSRIFDALESGDEATRRAEFPRLKRELDLHAHVEETIFYPALKEHPETRELATHAYSEHNDVKQMLDELSHGLDAGGDATEWQARLSKLRDNVEHHVREEEGEMFTRARRVLGAEAVHRLGERMTEAKQQHQQRPQAMSANARG
jgi:iron-sulfur cluster repair protein YtfE (RIC family)